MTPLESIGAVLAQPEFKLTEPPASRPRKSFGTPRARNSDIRRPHAADCPEAGYPSHRVGPNCTCGKKARLSLAERRAYRRTGRQPRLKKKRPSQDLMVEWLRTQPPKTTLNECHKAKDWKVAPRTVRGWTRSCERNGWLRRLNSNGGRGHGVEIFINHERLEKWLATPPPPAGGSPPTPASEKLGSGSLKNPLRAIRSGSASHGLRQETLRGQEQETARSGSGPDSGLEQPKSATWSTSQAQILAELAHGDQIQNPSARRRYRMGTIRRAAGGLAGLPLNLAKLVAAAVMTASLAIGKAAKRDDLYKAVILRLVHEGLRVMREIDGIEHWDGIQSWPELLNWIHGSERWLALLELERAAEHSDRARKTCPRDAPGCVFGADPVASCLPGQHQEKRVSPTPPMISALSTGIEEPPVPADRALQKLEEILASLKKGPTNG